MRKWENWAFSYINHDEKVICRKEMIFIISHAHRNIGVERDICQVLLRDDLMSNVGGTL